MSGLIREWHLATADATRAAGAALGQSLARSAVSHPLLIALSGELGAGKTTFVGGLLGALGHAGPVRSPTYTLIEPYQLSGAFAGREVFHLDLYRLTGPEELEELGLRDLMRPGAVLLVEWPERAGAVLDRPDLRVQLAYPTRDTEGRALRLESGTESGQRLIDSLHFSALEK